VCKRQGCSRLVTPKGLPQKWLPEQVASLEDDNLTSRELDLIDGALTGCALAIAETGTLILSAGPGEGRRAITLVPDLHICVVEAAQVVELVTEAIAALTRSVMTHRQPVTFIAGPAATSDIERTRVEGVHGPRTLAILLIED
jgi:L-lactate dehydrogenase complex protein LldG